MSQVKARGKVPNQAGIGDLIAIKTLLRHPMHSGRMKDGEGNTIPRKIIIQFIAKFNGEVVFSVDIEPSISSNPYIGFPFKFKEAGTFEFTWQEETGELYSLEKAINVA